MLGFTTIARGGASLRSGTLAPLAFAACMLAGCAPATPPPSAAKATPGQFDFEGWDQNGGGVDSSQYSSLKQINKTNVAQLAGRVDLSRPATRRISFNPIVVDGMMYVLAQERSIVALDAATRQGDLDAPERGRGRRPRHELLGERRRLGAAAALHQRRLPDRDRRDDRQHDRDLRRQGQASTCASASTRDVTNVRPLQTEQPGPHLREPDHHVAARGRRGLRLDARRHARLRRAHRQAQVGVPQRAGQGRVRRRHLARRTRKTAAASTTGAS